MSVSPSEREFGRAFAYGVAFARESSTPLYPGLVAEVTRVWEQQLPDTAPGKDTNPMALEITATQQFRLAVHAFDKKGNPAMVDGMTFTSDNPAIATVEQAENPMEAVVKAAASVGAVSIRFAGDADLDDGVRTLSGNFDVIVVGGEAVVFQATATAPEEQTDV